MNTWQHSAIRIDPHAGCRYKEDGCRLAPDYEVFLMFDSSKTDTTSKTLQAMARCVCLTACGWWWWWWWWCVCLGGRGLHCAVHTFVNKGWWCDGGWVVVGLVVGC